jgi:hypothetical protein
MSTQKFQRFDHIKIAEDLGSAMSHFKSGVEAIVLYSYKEKYGGRHHAHQYCLYFKGGGQSAWYNENQLTLIASGQEALYNDWNTQAEERKKRHSDLEWIFSPKHMTADFSLSGDSAQAIADLMDAGSLWGSRGEGWTWYDNYQAVARFALPYIVAGDKDGFMAAVEKVKESIAAARAGHKPEPCTPPYHPQPPEPEPKPQDKD